MANMWRDWSFFPILHTTASAFMMFMLCNGLQEKTPRDGRFLSQDCNNLGFFYMNCLSLTRTTSLSLISLKSKENKTSKNKEHDIKGRH
jgi:hypothetical protein